MTYNVRLLILLALAFLPGLLLSQTLNQTTTDPRTGEEILIGYCDREGLKTGDFGALFNQNYKLYVPERAVTNKLKYLREGADILIVLGTWCSDSEEQVPRFLKVLDKIKFKKKNVTLLCVDRDKKAGDIDTSVYDIIRVPTIIVYRKGQELGRIIEKPYRTLEKDLLMFLED